VAQYDQHAAKAEMFWKVAQKRCRQGTPFLAMNLIMYTVGHLIEALLAREGRHPGSPVRGVPHGDRGALLRACLVRDGGLTDADAACYGKLVADRDTFIDGGIQDRKFLDSYLATARPLIARLQELVGTPST